MDVPTHREGEGGVVECLQGTRWIVNSDGEALGRSPMLACSGQSPSLMPHLIGCDRLLHEAAEES